MILTQKEAKMLNRSYTIDLKYLMSKEYCDKVEDKALGKGLKNKTLNACIYSCLYIGAIVIILFIIANIFKIEYSFANEKSIQIKGINKELPKYMLDELVYECKIQKAKNKHHCIKTGLSILYAESTWSNTTYGLTSKTKNTKTWVGKYNLYWYKATNSYFFYGKNGKAGKSHYCTSETSSGSVGDCPNGAKNMWLIFINPHLDKIIKKELL